ncbi:hypothetical protein [Asticcacaulis sp. EMRT-3]|uniref:hypothetical protein n=1 Tax=Asticcacaulis sp. EMRT-3 TaxID=3040349 RepID=UPI0024AEE96E|nr:hypothetical protein [Asticcacaulis sp. EMRT-3]MDI7776463.1 hypothetical protein [Asticcacaulis sp. EMRT-3]
MPQAYDPFVDLMEAEALRVHFERIRQSVAQAAATMPPMEAYIERFLKAEPA